MKAIFFDFDGVIADSLDVKSAAFYEMYKPYGEGIAEAVVKHHLANGGMSRFEKFRIYHEEHLHITLTDDQVNELAGRFSILVVSEVIKSPFVNGVYEFLESNHRHYDFYIITGTPTQEMTTIARAKGIDSYFKGIFGSPDKKDHWVRYLLNTKGLAPNECIFIGDALSDYYAAVGNKVLFILREHPDNLSLFSDKQVIRIKDFMNFTALLHSIG